MDKMAKLEKIVNNFYFTVKKGSHGLEEKLQKTMHVLDKVCNNLKNNLSDLREIIIDALFKKEQEISSLDLSDKEKHNYLSNIVAHYYWSSNIVPELKDGILFDLEDPIAKNLYDKYVMYDEDEDS
jgi:hypothetical protein